MFKKIIFIVLLFFCSSTILVAQNKSWQCSFEEVYSDGQSNTGILLINSNNLRYEYDSHDLYTLIYKLNGQLYSIPNFQTEQIQIIQNNEVLFQELIKIYSAFPLLQMRYLLMISLSELKIANKINLLRELLFNHQA